MQIVSPSDYQPLVSIIVPITDDVEESAQRLAFAKAQSWHHLEVIPVEIQATAGLGQALNMGFSASQGEFISFLLPGASYTHDKIARQVAFVAQFDLQDAALFCDYTVLDGRNSGGVPVVLPSLDPAAMFRKIYCGLPIGFSSLLVPRKAMVDLGLFPELEGQAALQGFLLALSQHTNLVGMAASLVSMSDELAQLSSVEKRDFRKLYADLLPELVRINESSIHDANVFSTLGEATAARLGQGVPLAAWDILCTTCKFLGKKEKSLSALRSFVMPLLRSVLRRLPVSVKRRLRNALPDHTEETGSRLDFSAIYRDNGFVGTESLSGAGSTRFQTRIIRQKLPELFRELGVRSVLDIPCGDFHWMRDVDLSDLHYIGADLVDDMVKKNQQRFGSPLRTFECVDLIAGPLPVADLVFCRDCLVHLPYEDALAALDTIRQSKCQWLLTTTFTRTTPNTDLDAAGWRALNLTLPPFNLPPPIRLISEKCTEAGGLAGDKSLGLWRIADLQLRRQA